MTQNAVNKDIALISSTYIRTIDPIRNVVGGDFNYDGKLDILLSLQANQSSDELYFMLYFGHLNYFGKACAILY
jgi:hypothetical protein